MASEDSRYYSGPKSKAIWRRVVKADDQALYNLGCVLQQGEIDFLRALQASELKKSIQKKG